jgi:hypothetical protein
MLFMFDRLWLMLEVLLLLWLLMGFGFDEVKLGFRLLLDETLGE